MPTELPLLEVVTRCYRRPTLLAANQASLRQQSWHDWQQTLLVDEVGIGIAESYARLAQHEPQGQWLWILDDDDLCVYVDLVYDLSVITNEHEPDVIMLKMDHGHGNILPDDAHWQQPPTLGYIGVSAYVVKRDMWLQHRHTFAPGRYESDFDFITAVFAHDPEVYWHDVVASRCQRISRGKPA